MMSKLRGWGFYQKLRQNDVMIVSGNQQVSDLLKRGERLIAVGALNSYAADLKAAGHPIKTLYPSDGVFVIPSPTAVVKGSPDPAAAKLFAQFMIGEEVQSLFPADGGYSARIDIKAPAGLARSQEPEHHRGRRRLRRARRRPDQEAVQRDFPVGGCVGESARSSRRGVRLESAGGRVARRLPAH